MAGRKKTNKETRINFSHGNKLFEKLDTTRVRMLLEKVFPKTTISTRGPSGLLMNCLTPHHEDKHPSFFINTAHNYAKCYSCGYFTRNLLQLLQDCKGWSYKESVQQIQGLVGFRVVTEKIEKELEELDLHQMAYRVLFEVCNQHLLNCLSPPTDSTDYVDAFLRVVQPTIDWLFKERGHNKEFAPYLPYGVFPPQHMISSMAAKYLENKAVLQYQAGDTTSLTKDRREKILRRVAELVKDVDGSWTHSVTFHTGYALTTPGRMRLRRVTNVGEGRKSENITILPGFGDDDPVGFFGLYSPHFDAFTRKERESFVFFLVEGENDMLTAQEHVLAAGMSGVYFIASCGNANVTDALDHGGVSRVHILSDHPDPDIGRGEEWLKVRLSSAAEIDARVFVRWTELRANDINVKDPDEVIRTHGFDHFRRIVIDDVANSFIASDVWAAERAIEEASGIDPSETRQRMYHAIEFGQCVRHPAQLATFIDRMQRDLGLPAGPLRSDIVKAKDTEQGFINRIAETIRHEFHTLYKEDNARGGTLHLFHKKTRRHVHFFMTDGEGMLAAMSNIFGEMYSYFKDHIGLPPSYGDENTADLANTPFVRERQKDLAAYLKIAMQLVYHGVPSRDECIRIGQGPHLLADPENPAESLLYILNGRRVYVGRWEVPTNPVLTWTELQGPSHGKYLFEIADTAWSEEIRSVDDLQLANTIPLKDVREAIEAVFAMFTTHWRFTSQTMDSQFLAYHLFACGVATAFPSKVILAFVGQSQSGKSTAMSVFSGGQNKPIQLLEAVSYQSNYTMASLFQAFDSVSLMMALEEFTADPTGSAHKAQQVENINELLRQVIFDGGSVIRRGTVDGKTRSFKLHTNVATSSIHVARDVQDENRRFTIETVKVDGLRDPAIALFDTIPVQRFQEIRRLVTLGLLRHAKDLARHHEEISRHLSQKPIVSFSVPTRFLRNFLPAASVMHLLGENWVEFIAKTCESRKEKLAAVATDTAPSNLLSRIIHSPTIRVGSKGLASVQSLLMQQEDWQQLNAAMAGFYYDDVRKLGIIDWVGITSPNGLLYQVREYEKSVVRTLKHMFDQHPQALKMSDYATYKVFDTLSKCGVIGSEYEISVVQLSSLVEKLRVAAATSAQPLLQVVPGNAGSGTNNI